MRKLFWIFLLLVGSPALTFAQFTTVTATVQDPNGIPYSAAVMNAVLVGGSGSYTLNGQPYSGKVGPVTLSSTGAFTAQFGDVTLISPGSPQWQITITMAPGIPLPFGTGPQQFTYTSSGTTISGSSPVSLTSALNTLAPKLTNFAGSGSIGSCGTLDAIGYFSAATTLTCDPSATTDGAGNFTQSSTTYKGSTSGQAQVGVAAVAGTPSEFLYPTTDPTAGQVLQAAAPSAGKMQTSWASAATAGLSTITVSRACGSTPNCFQIVGDAVFDVDATYTASSPTVTTSSAAPAFVAGSVPTQIAWGTYNCNSISEASCTNNCPQSTMTYVSAHVVTLSNNCTHNSSATAHSNVFIWGTDDTTVLGNAFSAMFPAGGNASQTQELDLPAGSFIFGGNGNAPFIAPIIVVRENPVIVRGHNTFAIIAPKINCNKGVSNNSCLLDMGFYNNQLGNIGSSDAAYDITFWGGGTSDKDAAATFANPAYGILGAYGENYYNVWVIGWVWNRSSSTPAYGWFLKGGSTFGSGDYAGGNYGAFCEGFVGSTTNIFGGNWGAGGFNDLVVGGVNLDGGCTTHGVYFDQPQSGGGASSSLEYPVIVNSGSFRDFGSSYFGLWSAGGDSWLNGSQLYGFTTVDDIRVAAGIVSVSNSQFGSHIEQTGGTLIFTGGNHADGTTAPFSNPSFQTMTGGSAVGNTSVSGTCTGTVPATATTGGLYGTGSNITSTVCATIGGATAGNGIVMQAAGTMGMLQVATGTGGVNASSGVFTVYQNGVATTITCTVGTGIVCRDVTHYVAYAAGDLISIEYTSQALDTLANVKASVITSW